ncbi:MAG: LptF/LptG family permease [Planctomycetota bacterium]
MPFTLYRHMFFEVLKVLAVCASVLVVVLSFAAAVKPLSDGLLGPATLVKFVLYTIPTLLGFVLPFAGAFAATLVYTRLANDNELLACMASGISHRSILAPPLIMGLVLSMGLGYLSNFVVPWFYRSATEMVEGDIVGALVRRLDDQQAFVFKDQGMVIYADRARPADIEPMTTSGLRLEREIALEGVAVARLDRRSVASPATASAARVQFYSDPKDRSIYVRVKLDNPVALDDRRRAQQQSMTTESVALRPIRLPNPVLDEPRFMSWFDLRELVRDPTRSDSIRKIVGELSAHLAEVEVRRQIGARLAASEPVTFDGWLPGEQYELRAPIAQRTEQGFELRGANGRPVVVRAFEQTGAGLAPVRRFEADRATLRIDGKDRGLDPAIRIDLEQVRVDGLGGDSSSTELAQRELDAMTWPEPLFSDQARARGVLGFDELRDRLGAVPEAEKPGVEGLTSELTEKMKRLERRVINLRHQRAASAASCALLLPLGGLLAMRLKGQSTLAVFFWCFLLAILTLVVIHASENLTSSGSGAGGLAASLAFLWSGNVLLAVVLGTVYCQVARR